MTEPARLSRQCRPRVTLRGIGLATTSPIYGSGGTTGPWTRPTSRTTASSNAAAATVASAPAGVQACAASHFPLRVLNSSWAAGTP